MSVDHQHLIAAAYSQQQSVYGGGHPMGILDMADCPGSHLNQHSPQNSSVSSHSSIFSIPEHSPDNLDFSHSPVTHFSHLGLSNLGSFDDRQAMLRPADDQNGSLSLDSAHLSGSIGPNRVQTRRQARAAQQQMAQQALNSIMGGQGVSTDMQVNDTMSIVSCPALRL